MLALGGSLAIKTVVFTGFSLPMLFLLNSYAELAYEGTTAFVSENGTAAAPSLSVDAGALPSATAQNGTTPVASGNDGDLIMGYSRKECRKLIMVIAKRFMKILAGCSKELKNKFPEPEEYQKRFQCVIRCVLIGTNMLDENLRISNATMAAFFEIQIPAKYHELGWHFVTKCINEWGVKVDPDDEYCTNYGNYVKCLQNQISDC